MPFHKRVILELNECGFEDVSQYLTRLFDIEEAMRQEAGIGAKIWLMPKLKDEKELIETLKCGLIAAKASKGFFAPKQTTTNLFKKIFKQI